MHKEESRKTFDAFFLSKENLAFSKMGAICELEELHKVDLDEGYENRHACAEFVRNPRKTLAYSLQKRKFFSIQVHRWQH